MGKCEIKMPEKFLLKISKLGKETDKIVGQTLKAGGDTLLKSVKSHLKTVIGKDLKHKKRSTGELVNSLGVSPDDVDNKGIHNIKVGFNEPRRNQYEAKNKRSYYTITNAMIANVIEFGKSGQNPKPFLKPAKNKSRKACIAAMEEKLEEEINKL